MKKTGEKNPEVINIGNSKILKNIQERWTPKNNLMIFMRRRYWWRDQSGNLRSG